jgi:chorismate mutase
MALRKEGRGGGRARAAVRKRRRAPGGDPLEDLRRRIDVIDRKMVCLLNERAGWAIALGRVKQSRGMPIYQPAREEEVLRNVQGCNGGPLEEGALRRLFERIIDESRRIERIATVGPDPHPSTGAPGRDPEE